ncbi:type II toxin-antitoxin system YafQ family toxin [Bifidobacterium sp. ESL0775]|uniref:type II toxin-antitoxin system YafQ family toxin n=1 Tax=Bifidobacterium sp. ESL0775 TaxID=2983230 RepID=UPI0023F7EE1C|nr:type II toxin-antitoxin system YafQ family toxin [Bifidobacterium sp. ESL0775]WEV69522.1 type II toxin-antitoxin system YafQ family toxin [Bifidobacterium sp. ESL0775]
MSYGMLSHIKRTGTFLKDVKRLKRKHFDLDKLDYVIKLLMDQDTVTLIHQYDDHALKGNLHTLRELHIQPDWLLVYQIEHGTLTLVLVETGSHKQLLGK